MKNFVELWGTFEKFLELWDWIGFRLGWVGTLGWNLGKPFCNFENCSPRELLEILETWGTFENFMRTLGTL